MKNKLFLLFMVIGMLMYVPSVFSATDMQSNNITINYPTNNAYVSATGSTPLTKLNATVKWTPDVTNITNVSFVFTSGSVRHVFTNNTINGTRTTTGEGDFTYTITASQLTANTQYAVRVEIRNTTTLGNDGAVNSSAITYTLDSTNPVIALNRPNDRSSITPANKIITFEYTPTDTNFGNCTLYVSGTPHSSSTSGTTSPNVSTGKVNTFAKTYTADDSSESWIVECTDLAGLKTNSSSRAFNVIAFGGSPIEFTVGGAGVPTTIPRQQPQAIAQITQVASDTQNLLKQWAMPVVIIIVALLVFMVFRARQKR